MGVVLDSQADLARLAGPAWDNSSEYPSLTSPQFLADEAKIIELIETLEKRMEDLAPSLAAAKERRLSTDDENRLVTGLREISRLNEEAAVLLGNLTTFCSCERSVDASDQEATKKESFLATLRSRLGQARMPWSMFLATGDASLVESYLDDDRTRGERFRAMHARELSDTLLSEPEERLLTAMNASGHRAWSDLYDAISGNLKCETLDPNGGGDATVMGLAQANGYLRSSDENERKAAWLAIEAAWQGQKEPCAAILNALAGWRLEVARRRSRAREVDFLTYPTHEDSIRRETLEAMMTAIRSKIDIPRRALGTLAQALGKDKLDPWDLLSGAPAELGSKLRPFPEGFDIVAKAFADIDPEMGEFATMMLRNGWIEARVLPSKQQGAYCTGFGKSRSPRVFQTYMGSISDIKTLAHELGHAFHGWVMRDMARSEQRYPSTLAETASVFAETAVADALWRQDDEGSRLAIGWQMAESAGTFLLNIPARFEFERSFYELRSRRFVPADELCKLTERAWAEWYGDSLSRPDSMFWASKLHFSMVERSFYNYPYSFGYLFSLGLYARREAAGTGFLRAYKEILRDTGRMTAEDLIGKHLGEDITKPEFWLKSLGIVERKIDDFAELLAAVRERAGASQGS